MSLKEDIEGILKLTFEKLQYAYDHHKESIDNPETTNPSDLVSRLVFPSYSDGKVGNDESEGIRTSKGRTRISEQELRFSFVESFNDYCKAHECQYLYSIETPTRAKYVEFSQPRHKSQSNPHKVDEGGRSAEFDMVIYDYSLQRICLIEFKANNASLHDHKKDFVKLGEPKEGAPAVLRYFVEVLASYDNRTIASLQEKLETKADNTVFVCYSLEQHKKDNKDGKNSIPSFFSIR